MFGSVTPNFVRIQHKELPQYKLEKNNLFENNIQSLDQISNNLNNCPSQLGISKKKFSISKNDSIKNQKGKLKGLFGQKVQCFYNKQKLGKRISSENHKIKEFKQKLQQIACRDQYLFKQNIYKTASSSPYILREKKRRKVIQEQQLISRLHSVENLQPNKQKRDLGNNQSVKQADKDNFNNGRVQSIKQSNELSVCGLTPKWRQFQSWKRLRYKITIKGYRGKVDIRRIVS